MTSSATRTLPVLVVAACALALAACSPASQKPAALGATTGSTEAQPSSSSGTASSSSNASWIAAPSSIAMPAGLSFEWDYTPSGKSDVDQAVQAVEDINRGEIAGVGSSPQNADIIAFSKYSTGETLAWINATFANYRQNGGTWTGSVRYYKIATSDFRGIGVGESGVVQYCADATRMDDVVRSTGAKTSEGSDNYVLFTMKVAAVPGGWQASGLTTVAKDGAACVG